LPVGSRSEEDNRHGHVFGHDELTGWGMLLDLLTLFGWDLL
jgi:hypothetical protein